MRISILALIVIFALVLGLAGCDQQANQQPASSKTQNTINSTTVQNSASNPDQLRHPTAEEWKKATASDKLKNGPKNDQKVF